MSDEAPFSLPLKASALQPGVFIEVGPGKLLAWEHIELIGVGSRGKTMLRSVSGNVYELACQHDEFVAWIFQR